MGFIRANTLPLLAEANRSPFNGKVLFLGSPDIYFDLGHFQRMARQAKFSLKQNIPVKLSPKPHFAAKGYLSGETVFKMLGFESLSVLDCSSFEGADRIFDLNQPDLPKEWESTFDVIIDHGTLEHVFHLPNALHHIFKLLKPGGRAITSSPSSNFFDHGFYMLQPTLFLDFYTANRWKIESLQVVQFSVDQENERAPCVYTDYKPGLYDAIGYGKMDVNQKLYTTFCVASKSSESTGDRIPEQGYYRRLSDWKPPQDAIQNQPVADEAAGGRPRAGLIGRVKGFLKRSIKSE